MKRNCRIALLILAAAVFVGGTFMLTNRVIHDHRSEKTLSEARSAAGILPTQAPAEPLAATLDAEAAFLQKIDLLSLQAVNPDVLGWICIPDTGISYPLLQGTDNQYYLHHTWTGEANSLGSIFLECQMKPDFSDFNTIVYGHNMRNDSMFSPLTEYKTQSHYESHPKFYIAENETVRRYEIFAAFEAGITSPVYRLGINTPETKQIFLDYSAAHSVLDTGITPTTDDSVVTLSTCMGTGQHQTRWVVQGVLTGQFPLGTGAPGAER